MEFDLFPSGQHLHFGPHRFANAFFTFIVVEEPPQISLTQQTEFSEVQWIEPRNLLQQWKKHEIKVAPPVVTLLMEVERCLNLMDGDMERVAVDLEKENQEEGPSYLHTE